RAMERADGYAHRILVTQVLRGRRRTARLVVTSELPDVATDDIHSSADRQDLWDVVRGLPAMQRAVVVLRFYEDMTEAQVADVLDISVGTVKSHASRALSSMRARMPNDYAQGGAHD